MYLRLSAPVAVFKGADPIQLCHLVTRPAHSIINQAFDSRLRLDATRAVNGDGFGVGWYDSTRDAELGDAPCIFTSVTPAWNNQNLQRIAEKIKSPLVEHAMYVTINDIVLNAGSEHEQRRPFEIFINSKSMEHFQWIVALTRIMSAVFRKGGDVTFLVEEMKAVFDPKGGYFKAGGVYMPS